VTQAFWLGFIVGAYAAIMFARIVLYIKERQ
jgi:hypothetical protein